MDESKPDTSMSSESGNMNLGNRKELEDFFEKLSINVVTVEHPEVRRF